MAILKIKDDNGNIINIPAIKGDKGDAGITPHIGGNGNWFIGDADTGVLANAASAAKAGTFMPDITYKYPYETERRSLVDNNGCSYFTRWGTYCVSGNCLMITALLGVMVGPNTNIVVGGEDFGIELPKESDIGRKYANGNMAFSVGLHNRLFEDCITAIRWGSDSFIKFTNSTGNPFDVSSIQNNTDWSEVSFISITGFIQLTDL
jgi:hypothetical protein